MAGDHSRSQASFLPCTGFSPVTSLQIQSLLRLSPMGQDDLTSRVTTRMVTGTGFDPLPGLGVFPHGLCLPCCLAGLAIMQVAHLGVWIPPLSGIQPGPLTQAQGALRQAYGMSSSLECDSGHTSSLPLRVSGYSSILGYGHSHAKRCDFAGLILSVSTQTVIT